MPRETANGIDINYEVAGPPGAPVVTLSHSLATDLSMWEPQMAALTARYRVLRYDTRGHGATDATPPPYSFEVLAEDVRSLLTALGIEHTHFVGLSMGGMIGQALALAHPEMLDSLVLCDTSARTPPEAWPLWQERIRIAQTLGMQAHVEPTVGRWFTPVFVESHSEMVDPIRSMIASTSVDGYVGCAHAIGRHDLLDRLPEIDVPTLVITGAEDPAITVETARAIHERIAGSGLVVLEAASHLSNIEQPSDFDQALLSFLNSVK